MTTRQLNKLIQETKNCLYLSGIEVKIKYNPRIFRARTIKGQLQGLELRPYESDKWFDIPSNAKFIDGRNGKIIWISN